MPDQDTESNFGMGPATDSHNEPVWDPSRNVMDLVTAAIKRQDDLRAAESAHIREVQQRESDHVRELLELRAQFAKDLRDTETARIDAIRAVDVGAVNRAAEVAATQATTLASQVATSAETLRTQVAAAASAATIALAAALEPVQKDIADLRRAQYEAQGQKTQVVETRGASGNTMAVLGVVGLLLAIIISIVMPLILR